jgi:hypothetical protein
MLLRESSCLDPSLLVNVIIVALVSLIPAKHQNVTQYSLILQESDTGSTKFSLWLRDSVNILDLALIEVYNESSLDEH